MSVRQVKNAMYKLDAKIPNTLNSVNNLINILSWSTESTSNLVASQAHRLKANLSALERDIKFLHNMTAEELHIFFKEYNTLLSKTIAEFDSVETTLNELIEDSKSQFITFIINIFVNGSLLYRLIFSAKVDDLKHYIPQLVRLRERLTKIQSATNINNSKLIIKNNRGR